MKRIAALALLLWGCDVVEGNSAISPPDCETYCGMTFLYCRHGSTLYTQFGECMTACSAFPTTGALGDISGNTLQCRLTFAIAARRDPVPFCRNASEGGGSACQ